MPRIIDDGARASGSASDSDQTSQAEYERGCREGFAEGRVEGLAEGRRLERETLAALRLTLTAVVDDVAQRQEEWLEALDENLAALAVAIARQLIGRELEGNRDAVVELVRRALSQFPVGQAITIRLNPQDLTLLSDASADESATTRQDARWIADPRIDPGGCVVEGPDRVVDGRLDRALERVYRSLTDA